MDDIAELPPDLTRVLFHLGTRKLVLLEGQDDTVIFREWYRDRRDVVEFFSPEVPQGVTGVKTLLERVLARSTSSSPREYGIIDRDFSSDAEVEASLADPNSHLFILRRYCIENYLLEPEAVSEELRILSGSAPDTPNPQVMERQLLQLCRQLCTMIAANWVFVEAKQGRHFGEAHDLVDRVVVINRAAQELRCSKVQANQAVSEKESLLQPSLARLETAHQRINGKHLLFHVHRIYTKTGISKDQFRNLLARAIKERVGLHEDIREIMERRVLA